MIRTVLLITALIITLALTLATWLIPDPIEDISLDAETHQSDSRSNLTYAIPQSQTLDQIMQNNFDQASQFIIVPLIKQKEKKEVKENIKVKETKTEIIHPIASNFETPKILPPDLVYTGQMVDAAGVKKVFLTSEDQTLVLAKGDIISHRWKIESIQNHQITILDQISNQLFILNI